MKNSFGRVIEIKHSSDKKFASVTIRLATSLMNPPEDHEYKDRRLANWNVKECKRRSNTWLLKKIDALRNELTECLTGEYD